MSAAHHNKAISALYRNITAQLTALNPINIIQVSGNYTRNSIGRQFSGGKHDVAEIESGVVDAAELLVRVIGLVKILEWRLDPVEAG